MAVDVAIVVDELVLSTVEEVFELEYPSWCSSIIGNISNFDS